MVSGTRGLGGGGLREASSSLIRTTGLLCVAMVVGLVTVGLWPFAFRPTNDVRWLEEGEGLQFGPEGLAYDPEPLPAPQQPTPAAALTVELWAQPDLDPRSDVHYLLTIHDEHLPSNLVLCQWKTMLLLQVPANTRRGFRETGIPEALKVHNTKLIAMTCGPDGTSWYLDGHLAKQSPGFTIPQEALDGRLILGDSAAGKHGWKGRFYGLAMLSRTLKAEEVQKHFEAWTNHQAIQLAAEPGLITLLLFNEGQGQRIQDHSLNRHVVLIPQPYHTLYKSILTWPSSEHKLISTDVWINLSGFAPFGFLFYWHRRLKGAESRVRSAGLAIMVGGAISLFIEVTQIWLPNRDSSALDLACNVLGTLLGACTAFLVWRYLPKPGTSRLINH